MKIHGVAFKTIILIFALVTLSSCATQKTAHIDSAQIIDKLGAFNFGRRLEIYETIDNLASQLLRSPSFTILKMKEIQNADRAVVLELIDRDGDGKADEFAFPDADGKMTADFGFIFDLNRDGKTDYMVFNGGLILYKDFTKSMWMNYHWIDSNYDGKIDIIVYNDLCLSGCEAPDEGITAWFYDSKFIEQVDKAEYLGKGFEKPIEQVGGFYIFKQYQMGEKKIPASKEAFFNKLLSEINSMLP